MGKEQELLEAARHGNIAVVENILLAKSKRSGPFASLRRGPGTNVQDSSGYSALHHASLNGHADVVRELLANDAQPNLPDTRGSSPLHLAAWAGHQEIVNLLLTNPNRPANPNLQTKDNETPLHCAAQHGHTGALTTLLAHAADPNRTNSRGETPLELAAQYGRLQAVQMLIRAHPELLLPFRETHDGQVPLVTYSPLHLASRNGHRNVVLVLLAAGVSVNLRTAAGSALHEAALCGKDKVVRTLLDAGADLEATDANGRTAMDLLEEFPPHVTRGIVSVINNHRNSMTFESESEDFRDDVMIPRTEHSGRFAKPSSIDSSYESHHNAHQSKQHCYRRSPMQCTESFWNSHLLDGVSPSSSMSSFEPPSPTRRSRANTDSTPGVYVTMAPINAKVSPTPPKKPPRRILSASPTHPMSASMDGDMLFHHSGSPQSSAYEHMSLAPNGGGRGVPDTISEGGHSAYAAKGKAASVDQYVYVSAAHPVAAPRTIKCVENSADAQFRTYNTNRKLRRHPDDYDVFTLDRNAAKHAATAITQRSQPMPKTPSSPSHYKQPPTPEHPPPNAELAEQCIHDRMRQLGQEYKRRSAVLQLQQRGEITAYEAMVMMGSSPPRSTTVAHQPIMVQSSLGASSGSLSSSVSLSDRSGSTDCVEEFIGDAPFSGLFKGSTMALNVTNKTYLQNSPASPSTNHGSAAAAAVRPTTLRTQTLAVPADATQRAHQNGTAAGHPLSPFNEQEEWAKISEIMAKFGTEHVTEDMFSKGEQTRRSLSASRSMGSPMESRSITKQIFGNWLEDVELAEHEALLTEHGFDDIDFLNGILEKSDALAMGLDEPTAVALLTAIRKLPRPQTFEELRQEKLKPTPNNNNTDEVPKQEAVGAELVEQWLISIRLLEYLDVFSRHLYTDMDRICRVWEVELQAVLEIGKVGHRKRIMYSVAGQLLSPPLINEINDSDKIASNTTSVVQVNTITRNGTATRTNHGKNRMAPQPPKPQVNLEIRAPAELLLGVPVGLQANWRHQPADLVAGLIKYEVNYLGSTVIKEHRGTESTRKSIQKLKRDHGSSTINDKAQTTIPENEATPQESVKPTSTNRVGKRPLILSISHRGVQFVDIATQNSICEHEIRNIDCACQDSDDLSHFAYITKDATLNKHYCHVFNVESMDLATTIILTLGQAFEVAYQLALRNTSAAATTPIRSPMNGDTPKLAVHQNGFHSTANAVKQK